jgi:6-phosphogluconolactonase
MLIESSETLESAAASLAKRITAELREAVGQRGRASLLVPGGRTPVPLFHALRRCDLPWQDIAIGLTDERWVPADHADSNSRLVRAELLVDAAAAARFVPMRNTAPTAVAGAVNSWRALSSLPRPFDVVVLGMGEDGHFASLFPDSQGLAAAMDLKADPGCVPMRAPSAPVERISLNLAALASARHLFLFITGKRKRELMESAPARAGLPVESLLALRNPEPVVYWAP